MRILMTADAVGGVWTYAIELIRALGVFDIDVVMATMGNLPTSEQLDELADISNLTIETSEFKLEWMNDPGRMSNKPENGSFNWKRNISRILFT